MKLLQVCNVATRIGGTGACAWTIARCLPDWEHAFAFPMRHVLPGIAEDFGHPCHALPNTTAEDIERLGADVVIFHNASPYRMPQACPPGVPSLYYQHSPHSQCIESRRRCDETWVVSKYLAGLAGVDPSKVVYQPVPSPLRVDALRLPATTIGRLCTPNRNKWPADVPAFYARLAADNPQVHWEFVGAPDAIAIELRKVLGDRLSFHAASWEARSRLWAWDAMLYSGPPETYGRVVCEAQRAQCIPIVDDAGGFREQVEHGRTGFLCRGVEQFSAAVGHVPSGDVCRAAKAAADERGSLSAWRTRFLTWLESLR